jgi:alkyl hydroperoxide reductase subunit AhpF
MDKFTDEQVLTLLEMVRVAMSDAEIADSIADKMDMSDEELISLREKLTEELSREQTDEEKEYVNNGGFLCPICKKGPIFADGSVEVDGGVACQGITCESCGASWNDIYRLIGIDDVKQGTMPA